MGMMKLLTVRSFSDADMAYIRDGLSDKYEFLEPETYSDGDIIRLAPKADVILGYRIWKELLDSAANLKLIQVPGAGVDKVDMGLLRGRDVILCNSKSAARYVAEYAVSLALAAIKKIPLHDRLMRAGEPFSPKGTDEDLPYLSDTLLGRMAGFVGYGDIARYAAEYLAGFSVKVIKFTSGSGVLLEDLLVSSDVIFVTAPLTPKTRDLISGRHFDLMKRTAYLVNVSRGPVVNQEALFNALKDRKIAGAAIDVWYEEGSGRKGYPSDKFPFHELDNVTLSPYRAGYVMRQSPHLLDVVKNLRSFAESGKVINRVDIERGY